MDTHRPDRLPRRRDRGMDSSTARKHRQLAPGPRNPRRSQRSGERSHATRQGDARRLIAIRRLAAPAPRGARQQASEAGTASRYSASAPGCRTMNGQPRWVRRGCERPVPCAVDLDHRARPALDHRKAPTPSLAHRALHQSGRAHKHKRTHTTTRHSGEACLSVPSNSLMSIGRVL